MRIILRPIFFVLALVVFQPLAHAVSTIEQTYSISHVAPEQQLALIKSIKSCIKGKKLLVNGEVIPLEHRIGHIKGDLELNTLAIKASENDYNTLVERVIKNFDSPRPPIYISLYWLKKNAKLTTPETLERSRILDRKSLVLVNAQQTDINLETLNELSEKPKAKTQNQLAFTLTPELLDDNQVSLKFDKIRFESFKRGEPVLAENGQPLVLKTKSGEKVLAVPYVIREKDDYKEILKNIKTRGY